MNVGRGRIVLAFSKFSLPLLYSCAERSQSFNETFDVRKRNCMISFFLFFLSNMLYIVYKVRISMLGIYLCAFEIISKEGKLLYIDGGQDFFQFSFLAYKKSKKELRVQNFLFKHLLFPIKFQYLILIRILIGYFVSHYKELN